MKRKIMNKINSTNWKFHELLKLKEVAQSVSSELYHELDLKDQLDMIWEVNIGKDLTFGSLFKQTVMSSLESEVMNAFQEKFESATVSFSGEEKSITPSLPVEKPTSLTNKYNKKEPSQNQTMEDLISGKDVIPPLELKDGKVTTRAGNIKVERV